MSTHHQLFFLFERDFFRLIVQRNSQFLAKILLPRAQMNVGAICHHGFDWDFDEAFVHGNTNTNIFFFFFSFFNIAARISNTDYDAAFIARTPTVVFRTKDLNRVNIVKLDRVEWGDDAAAKKLRAANFGVEDSAFLVEGDCSWIETTQSRGRKKKERRRWSNRRGRTLSFAWLRIFDSK